LVKNLTYIHKKKEGLIKKLDWDYLPELEKMHNLIIKKNYEFFEELAEKRKCFQKMK